MKNFFVIIVAAVSLFLAVRAVSAQVTPAVSSRPSNLSFPIAELGNCTSIDSCKTYCDDPVHTSSCIAYAKQKGFYHESTLDNQQEAVLADAKTTLGCDSIDSCKVYCSDASHADVCSTFAQKHNLAGGKKTPDNATLEKAKTTLGCDSIDSCRTICSQEENKAKCASFAKQNRLRGGDEKAGPGGCTSEESCKVFCSNPNNFQTCSSFMQSKVGSGSAEHTFTGPGGCTSEESCRSFCDRNPNACHMNPAGHEAPMSATAAARIQNLQDCSAHPEKCRPSGIPLRNPEFNRQPGITGQQEIRTSSQNSQLPQRQGGSEFQQDSLKPTFLSPSPIPSNTVPAVRGAAAQISFFDWFVYQIFHLK